MLPKSSITQIPIHSEEWFQNRLGKFTASKIHLCMKPKGIGEGGLSYIRSRIGEELTGISSEKDFKTDAMMWGLEHEVESIKRFQQLKQAEFVAVQSLICKPDSRFSCTPDAIWVKSESSDGLSYEVATYETKSYPTYENHIACALCETPAQIKIQDVGAYYQTIMQMDECGALVGFLGYFNPAFKVGSYRLIEFRKVHLIEEFKLLNQRKKEMLDIFNKEREVLINL